MNHPLISVVIPARDRELTIGYCLRSVFAQTYPHFEIIVVDDGSSDNTAGEVLAFSDRRLRYVRHDSAKGAQAARNTGVKAAQGQWIAFLDSDDEWLPTKLEKQINVLESHGWNQRLVIHANMFRFIPATGQRKRWKLPIIEGSNAYLSVLRTPGPVFQTIVVSKSALEEIGWLDEQAPSYQEWDTAIRLAKTCNFVQIREPLAVYWLHDGETISKNGQLDINGYRYIIEKHREEILRVAGSAVWNRHMMRLARRCANYGFFNDSNSVIKQIPLLSYYHGLALAYLYLAIFKRFVLLDFKSIKNNIGL